MSTVQEVLQNERLQNPVDSNSLAEFLYTPTQVPKLKLFLGLPPIPYDFNIFNKSRVDIIKNTYKTYPGYLDVLKLESSGNRTTHTYAMRTVNQSPLTIHTTMFSKCIQILGTEAQQAEWFEKAVTFKIWGCYAQTELGHGSDVQNLETTATYVMENDTFIINTPTVSAAKFWPGDLGILCTHALVFAQLIIQEKNHGVHSFIVPVRDVETFELLPGVEAGDIGPKYGFHAKDNGYLILNNIVIPKRFMLRRFISVSKKGEIKKKGDPKVSYATMMVIRQAISCALPRVYGQAIIIAGRYSIFRKQFLDSNKAEIPIINYQSQKEKIITRIAEYFAVTLGGNAVKDISDRNLVLVRQKNDFSLMNESHVCLCIGKALFTQIVYEGMQTCRKSCGGHGFSHYSGLPNLLSEFAANLTYEGENTILYLQVTRFLLKNYKYALTKKKPVGQTVKYLDSFHDIMSARLTEQKSDWKKWTVDDIKLLLTQAACYCLSSVAEKMMNKPEGMSDLDVWNKIAGIQIKRAGFYHSLVYTFENFRKAIENNNNFNISSIVQDLCMLFGASTLITYSAPLVEGGFVQPYHLSAINRIRQIMLEKIRPQIVGILDSFLIPQHHIRSAIAHGDPYQNNLDMARKCQINSKIIDSAFIVRNNIQNAIKIHQPKL